MIFYRIHNLRISSVAMLAILMVMLSPVTVPAGPMEDDRQYSPPVANDYPQRVYWGDTHLHTNYSADSYSYGTQSLSPAEAYQFARGRALTSETGWRVQLKRPLDFLAVTDHAEYLGGFLYADAGDEELLRTELGRRWRDILERGEDIELIREIVVAFNQGKEGKQLPEAFRRRIWKEVTRTADDYNEPGRFTTLIGYEWTSQIDGNNLHRVVLYKDDAETASSLLPFSALDSRDPEDLWRFLADYEAKTGGQILAIPHNPNVSNGMMFAAATLSGDPLSADYARRRSRWEPLLEVTQVKGDSETHPILSPTDEFADYQRWDQANIMMNQKKEPWMLPTEYARSALQLGLQHGERLGVNPFKFGMVGGTDSHTSLSTTTSDNYFGKFPNSEPSAERMFTLMAPNIDIPSDNWRLGVSGLAAVWARDNTREALFEAMQRRETYATTGTRIQVRFFGGWDFEADTVHRADYAKVGYERGVPMGGTLATPPEGAAPVFMVTASRDPEEANLDRVQIIKGWIDERGERQEKIYDVALADGREVDPETGKAPPVGNTVNVADATYSNSIGDPHLAAVWTDPDFDPQRPAVYYVRVIEIPTPRWTAYDAAFFGTQPPPEVPMVTTNRAYTSPIWYEPVK